MRGSSMSYVEMVEAEERGRQIAEQMVATNPDAKRRVEETFGVTYCKRRYPMAYQQETREDIGSGA